MSSGGSIQAMITTMKNNARRRKTSDKSMAGMQAGSLYASAKNQPKHTQEQINETKAAFKIKAAQENRQRKLILISVIIAAPIVCYELFEFLGYLIH